jgi:hypothetical protein
VNWQHVHLLNHGTQLNSSIEVAPAKALVCCKHAVRLPVVHVLHRKLLVRGVGVCHVLGLAIPSVVEVKGGWGESVGGVCGVCGGGCGGGGGGRSDGGRMVVVAVVTITHHVAQLFVPIPLLTPWSYMVHPPAGRSRNFGIGLPTNAPVRPMPVWS